ncbi:MAG: hypothetical protein ABIO17_12290 [Pseudoxanthomonas sp.]
MARLILVACIALVSSACVPSSLQTKENPNTPKLVQASAYSVDDAYRVMQSNLVRCFAGPNYLLAASPSSPTTPPQIVVNGSLGHLFTVLDFRATATGSDTMVALGYALRRESRTSDWKTALNSWLVTKDETYCPRMP